MPYGTNDQGQTVYYEGQPPPGVRPMYTPPRGASYTPSHTDYQSRYLNNYRAGDTIEQLLGVKPGQYATVGGQVKNKGLWERYTESPLALGLTAAGVGIGLPALLAAGGAGGGGAAGGALLPNLAGPGSSIYGGLAAAGAPGAASAGAIGGGAAALLPNLAAPGSATYSGLAGGGGGARAGGAAMGTGFKVKDYIPALVNLFTGLWGSRETSAEKAQADMLRQQAAYLAYQQSKEKAKDPLQDALIRMAMGLMPTYSQGLFANYQGLPGVSNPAGQPRSTTPGIGGGGYRG